MTSWTHLRSNALSVPADPISPYCLTFSAAVLWRPVERARRSTVTRRRAGSGEPPPHRRASESVTVHHGGLRAWTAEPTQPAFSFHSRRLPAVTRPGLADEVLTPAPYDLEPSGGRSGPTPRRCRRRSRGCPAVPRCSRPRSRSAGRGPSPTARPPLRPRPPRRVRSRRLSSAAASGSSIGSSRSRSWSSGRSEELVVSVTGRFSPSSGRGCAAWPTDTPGCPRTTSLRDGPPWPGSATGEGAQSPCASFFSTGPHPVGASSNTPTACG
jgi:hypothetical protein